MKRYGGLVLVAAMVLMPAIASAAGTGGAGMPWDVPVQNISSNVAGILAPLVVLIGIVLLGLKSIFGMSHMIGTAAAGMIIGGSIAMGPELFMTALSWAGAVV